MGLVIKPTLKEEVVIQPLLFYNGNVLDGVDEVFAQMRAQKTNLQPGSIRENARRSYTFPQTLSPYFLVLRTFYLWNQPAPLVRRRSRGRPIERANEGEAPPPATLCGGPAQGVGCHPRGLPPPPTRRGLRRKDWEDQASARDQKGKGEPRHPREEPSTGRNRTRDARADSG